MAGTDPDFPKNMWHLLLPQVDFTLNLLRPCKSKELTSAWDFVEGPYDFKRHPFGPAGTKVIVYESANTRSSMSDHGVLGYYLSPAFNHYRCFNVWIPSTKSTRVCDTLSWHTHDPYGILSNQSPQDTVITALDTLTCALDTTTADTDRTVL